MPDDSVKMWIVLRQDLNMPLGKALVQAAHAACGASHAAYLEAPEEFIAWHDDGATKIAVGVSSEDALLRVQEECKRAGITCQLVTDAGRTVFPERTRTCIAVGPCVRSALPSFVRRLRLLEEQKEKTE